MPDTWKTIRERASRLYHENRRTLLAFALPALILFIGYMTRGIYPVHDRNVLTIDLYHQYAPFMAELQDKFTSGGSLLFSWSGGMGVNFLALFAYYLASPLNILIILFPPSYLTEAIMILTLIKIGLAGAFFHIFLRGVWRQESLTTVAISILYALSSYNLAYSWNIMWLDGIFLLPLIMLGLVRLIREKKCLLYTVSLGLLIYSNYYIAFFIVIFTFLYFFLTLFEYHSFAHPARLAGASLRFAFYSLIGAGLSAVLALPTYFSLKLTSAAGDTIPKTVTHYFELFDYIGQHFMLTPPTIRDGMPNMYSGVLALILIPIYFFARSISLRQKLWHLALILILILSFNVNVLNFIWHGFHFPNQLPYRNSFVYIFLILSMAWPALQSLKEFSGKQIGAICASLIAIVLLAQKLNDKAPELQTLYVTIIFIVIYAAILTLDRIRVIHRSDMAMAVLIVVVAELLINTLMTLHRMDTTEYYSKREGYMAGQEVEQIREQLAVLDEEEPLFYRVEILPTKTTNDPFMYQYNGISIFSSAMQTKPVKMFANLGYHSNGINSYKCEGSTLLLDSLFGIKYIIRRTRTIDYTYLQPLVDTSELEVFRNPYAVSLGFVGQPELGEWRSSSGDPFSAQNRLAAAITGLDAELLHPLDLETGELKNMTFSGTGSHVYSYTRTSTSQSSSAKVNIINPEDQNVYLYWDTAPNKPDFGYVMLDEKKVEFNAKRSTLIDLGWVTAGTPIEFNVSYKSDSSETGQFELYASGLDKVAFETTMGIVKSQSMDVTAFSDTRVSGSITAAEDGVMMMTTPYDKGWRVEVDGEKVETRAVDDGFLSFDITAGVHEIEMRFMPEWFVVGLLISLASLLLLIFSQILLRRRQNWQPVYQPGTIRPFTPGRIQTPSSFDDLDREDDDREGADREGADREDEDRKDDELGQHELVHDELGHDELVHDELGHDELGHDELGHNERSQDNQAGGDQTTNHPAGDGKATDGYMADGHAQDDLREDGLPIQAESDGKADAHERMGANSEDEPFVRNPDNWDAAETEKTGDTPKSINKLPF